MKLHGNQGLIYGHVLFFSSRKCSFNENLRRSGAKGKTHQITQGH